MLSGHPRSAQTGTLCLPKELAIWQAAGGAFGILFKGGGGAVDQVIPTLLASLSGEEADQVRSVAFQVSKRDLF